MVDNEEFLEYLAWHLEDNWDCSSWIYNDDDTYCNNGTGPFID